MRETEVSGCCVVWWVSPLTAAGKGLANFSTYSASASAWLSFPLKMICTAPWKQGEERVIRSCRYKNKVMVYIYWGKKTNPYLGPHDGDLGGGPGVVHVASQVLGAHHVVGSSVGLDVHTVSVTVRGLSTPPPTS